ncbi:MAG: anti-sigma factor [Candidatus Ozemobacteraceae bacterium]
MTCERDELLQRFHDGDLPNEEVAAFKRHLGTCPSCRTRLHLMQESERQVREVIQRVVPSGRLAERVLQRIKHECPSLYPQGRPGPKFTAEAVSFFFGTIPGFLRKCAIPALAVLCIVFFLRSRPVVQPKVQGDTGYSFRVESLSTDARYQGNQLPVGVSRSIEPDKTFSFDGSLLCSVDGPHRAGIRFRGNGRFALSAKTLSWESGEGELDFSLTHPFLLSVGEAKFTITGTRIHLSGVATDVVQVTLLEGHVRYRTPDEEGDMIPGTPITRVRGAWQAVSAGFSNTGIGIPASGNVGARPSVTLAPPTSSVLPIAPETMQQQRLNPFEHDPEKIPPGGNE